MTGHRKLLALAATLLYLLAVGATAPDAAGLETLSWAGFAAFSAYIGGNGVEHWAKKGKG